MNRKILSAIVMVCFIFSVVYFLCSMNGDNNKGIDPQTMGRLCIAQVYPDADIAEYDKLQEEKNEQIEVKKASAVVVKNKKKNKKVDNSKPEVIIYHTHSSESYQPYTDNNFHRQGEAGTVREVGKVLAEELNSLGIAVVHDKTIHDSPSYNQSYEKSLQTISSLMKKYPTAKIVIDLHRDAAAYTGNVGETIKIKGETVAKYKLVIGQSNSNYRELMNFAGKINAAADKLYPGFSGRIIEKEYNYNEYIADNYLLLEVGNNQNDIKEVRKTGKYFAHVLAEVLED